MVQSIGFVHYTMESPLILSEVCHVLLDSYNIPNKGVGEVWVGLDDSQGCHCNKRSDMGDFLRLVGEA